jgi:endonuclease-8
MPEGDSLHRVADRLQVLTGQRLEVETPHLRAAGKGIAEQLDGRRLERVEAVGKNLLLHFEGDLVLRSHLRMKGRWRVAERGAMRTGTPWLVLRSPTHEAMLWNGPVLELERGGGIRRRLGPDVLAVPLALDAIVSRLRAGDQSRPIGEAILDQRVVSGIGNLWKAECLWEARVSPWRRLREVSDDELRTALEAAHRLMDASVRGARPVRHVYRRVGRPCPSCGTPIQSRAQGDEARIAYWCPTCQPGKSPS